MIYDTILNSGSLFAYLDSVLVGKLVYDNSSLIYHNTTSFTALKANQILCFKTNQTYNDFLSSFKYTPLIDDVSLFLTRSPTGGCGANSNQTL